MTNSDSGEPALDGRTRGLIRAILYPVIFRLEPDEHDVARVLKMVVNRGALDASPSEYQAAILKALYGRVPLSDLSDNERPDSVTRRFLSAVLRQMEHDAECSG
jgi:hypothetical protein